MRKLKKKIMVLIYNIIDFFKLLLKEPNKPKIGAIKRKPLSKKKKSKQIIRKRKK
jgi:hypothetical protein